MKITPRMLADTIRDIAGELEYEDLFPKSDRPALAKRLKKYVAEAAKPEYVSHPEIKQAIGYAQPTIDTIDRFEK